MSNLASRVRYQAMYPTPTTMDHIDRKGMRPSRAATNRKTGYLSEMIKMYPTPTVDCEEGGEQSNRVERTKSGGFILRKKNKPEMTYGAKLSDAMLYLNKPKVGGKLNPNFVEFLMAYPQNWTKTDQTELKH